VKARCAWADSIGSAIAYAHLKNLPGDVRVRPARAGELNSETRYVIDRFALPTPELLTRATGRRLILVDHNEVAQVLDDVQHATILEIWEHHRVGDKALGRPLVEGGASLRQSTRDGRASIATSYRPGGVPRTFCSHREEIPG